MTEAEWLTSTDPQAMLEAWHQASLDGWGRPSFPIVADRKLRLFACACCRAAGVEVRDSDEEKPPPGQADLSPLQWAMSWAFRYDGLPGYPAKVQRAAFIRDIFGNPWRRPKCDEYQCPKCGGSTMYVTQAGHGPWCPECPGRIVMERPIRYWLTWHDSTVVKLAQAAYDERHENAMLDAGRLAVIADALEESGCTDAEILAHCRGGGVHVRGCWMLDLLLGKE